MTPRLRLALLVFLALVASACAEDESPPFASVSPSSMATTSPSPTETAEATETESPEPTETPTESESPSPALEDGRHFGDIVSIDVEEQTLVLDLAYFLMGDEANEAAEVHGDEVPVPNDYYIVNDNPKLRTFPVQSGISVQVLNWAGNDSSAASMVPFAQWANRMPGGSSPQQEWIRAPYWFTITGGVVVGVEQQYLP